MMRVAPFGALLVSVAASLLAVTCAGPPTVDGETPPPLGPGELLPPDTIDYDFSWRQLVTIDWGEGSESFDAVLQKRGDVLELVGLGPMGRPAFVITQDADGVSIDNLSGRELPFEPAYMIADVQKAMFPWGGPVAPGFDGQRTIARAGLTLTESWEAGELVQRAFVRGDAPERGELTVEYSGWAGGDAPDEATLDSGWFGYNLTVRTLEQTRL